MNKSARSGKATSGGGIRSRVNKEVRQRVAPRSVDVVNPAQADYLGQATAFSKGSFYEGKPPDFAPMGNTRTMGTNGPGVGREVLRCGTQGFHGTASKGEAGVQGKADRGERQILGPPQGNRSGTRGGQQE